MSRLASRLQFNLSAARYIPAVSAALTVAMGLLVMIGWHVRSTAFIQVFPELPAMQYNTALCFCLLGVAFGLLLLGRRRMSVSCSGGVSGLAGVVVSQYVAG